MRRLLVVVALLAARGLAQRPRHAVWPHKRHNSGESQRLQGLVASIMNSKRAYDFFAPSEPRYEYDLPVELVVPAVPTHYHEVNVSVPAEHASRCASQECFLVGGDVMIDQTKYVHHVELHAPSHASIPNLVTGMPAHKHMSFHSLIASEYQASIVISHLTSWGVSIHFHNPERVAGVLASTTIRIHYTTTPRPMIFLISVLVHQGCGHGFRSKRGDTDGCQQDVASIPPGEARFAVTRRCVVPSSHAGAVVLSGAYHGHHNAREMYVSLKRHGRLLAIVSVPDFKYGVTPEGWWAKALNLRNLRLWVGDEIIATCVYNTVGRNASIPFGGGASEEMCLMTITYGLERATAMRADGPIMCTAPLGAARLAVGADAMRTLAAGAG